MRTANLEGRLTLLGSGGAIDVERASDARFGSDPQAIYAQWAAFRQWAADAPKGAAGPLAEAKPQAAAGPLAEAKPQAAAGPLAEAKLGPPAPRPAQVFGIGLNYRAHAAEAGLMLPDRPATFTKFPSCLTGPYADIVLAPGMVDWEVELVVVIGARAYRVAEANAWDHVAGLTVGQDVSERALQWSAGAQFSLGKSLPTFGPMGPYLVTPDELANRDDLELGCSVNGEVVQKSRTSDMVFSVPKLIAELSAILPLLPGDVMFTGTPEGIGATRKPPRFLQHGDVLESWVEGIGKLRNRCVAAA